LFGLFLGGIRFARHEAGFAIVHVQPSQKQPHLRQSPSHAGELLDLLLGLRAGVWQMVSEVDSAEMEPV